MEMDKFEPSVHTVLPQIIESFEKLRRIESELRRITTRFLPFPRAGIGQFYAYTDSRGYFQSCSNLIDGSQLVEFLYHQNDATPHLVGQQCQLNIILIFIAIADYQRILIYIGGEHGMEFRFRPSLQTNVEFLPMADNLLDHRAHLVDLNRIYYEILSLIAILLRSLFETI